MDMKHWKINMDPDRVTVIGIVAISVLIGLFAGFGAALVLDTINLIRDIKG
jgi:hypothetical protein